MVGNQARRHAARRQSARHFDVGKHVPGTTLLGGGSAEADNSAGHWGHPVSGGHPQVPFAVLLTDPPERAGGVPAGADRWSRRVDRTRVGSIPRTARQLPHSPDRAPVWLLPGAWSPGLQQSVNRQQHWPSTLGLLLAMMVLGLALGTIVALTLAAAGLPSR